MAKHCVILTFLLIFLLLSSSGCLTLREAYVPEQVLTEGWHENKGKSEYGSNYFGLQRWSSFTYENGESVTLTVTTLKTLIMMDKTELLNRLEEEILKAGAAYGIEIDKGSKTKGSRTLGNGHKSSYLLYNGTKEEVRYRIIGEVWSCSKSGVSVICLGLADLSQIDGVTKWEKMVGDPNGTIDKAEREDGLIYNVNCH